MHGGRSASPLWTTLTHHGVGFPPPFRKGTGRILVRGKPVDIDADAHEAAFLWRRALERRNPSAHAKKNFWTDWRPMLTDDQQNTIASLDAVDFSAVDGEYVRSASSSHIDNFATLDGKPVPLSKHIVDPPTIFFGRGNNHPLDGRFRRRITAQDVTLNLSDGTPPPNGEWGKVIHDPHLDWVASWRDPLTKKVKYVYLAIDTDRRQNMDKDKFEHARSLHKILPAFERHLGRDLRSSDPHISQVATCVWMTYMLLIRVGKPGDVRVRGATTLLAGDIVVAGARAVILDFVGKDSVRYHRYIKNVDGSVVRNLKECKRGKKATDMLFVGIDRNDVNSYLDGVLPGLTSKVLRTVRASTALQEMLRERGRDAKTLLAHSFARVALLCNHRKKSTKSVLDSDMHAAERMDAALARGDPIEDIMRELNVNTTKANYIDPRIVVSFCKQHKLPLSVAFTPTQMRRLHWATRSDHSFLFG